MNTNMHTIVSSTPTQSHGNTEEYKDENIDMIKLSEARIICFPLSPKPHEVVKQSNIFHALWAVNTDS